MPTSRHKFSTQFVQLSASSSPTQRVTATGVTEGDVEVLRGDIKTPGSVCVQNCGDYKPMRVLIRAQVSVVVLASFMTIAAGHHAAAEDAGCPWFVQAHEPIVGLGSNAATYEIIFNGLDPDDILYGFTATDRELASQLIQGNNLSDLSDGMVSLQGIEQDNSLVYKLPPDSILPKTIYLVVAPSRVDKLEQIDARIEPPRPVSVVTRGASDHTGPLPHQSVPGIEIISMSDQTSGLLTPVAEQGIQICAYQVSWG